MATAATVFRNYETDGVPSSGNHKPKKSDIRTLLTGYESIINAFTSNGGLIFSSLALLNADLAHGANSMAWVLGDSTVANNGVYRKNGGSGSGSWTRVADLPFSFIIATDAGAGTANAIQATTSIPVSESALVWMNIFEANTASPVSVSFNGGSALGVKTNSGNDVAAGGLVAGMIVLGVVSGSTFRLVSDQASSAIVAAAEAAQAAAEAAAAGANGVRPAATRTAMKAFNTNVITAADLVEGAPASNGRMGRFYWCTGDFSTEIAADPNEGVYVKADAIAATAGAWVRANWAKLDPHWFGCAGDGVTDDTANWQALIDFIAAVDPERKSIAPGAARYLINGTVTIPEECTSLDVDGSGPYASQFLSNTLVAGDMFVNHALGTHWRGIRWQNYAGGSDTVAASAVTVATDTITVPSNTFKWQTGCRVELTTTGSLPGGLSLATVYYVIRISSTSIKLATSLVNANAGTAIDITSQGTGSHTLNGSFDVTNVVRRAMVLTKDYGASLPEADVDAKFTDCEFSRFHNGIYIKGRGLRVENCLFSVSQNPIAIDWPDVGTYTAGPNVQQDAAGFRGFHFSGNRFHSNISSAIVNKGTNKAKIVGIVIQNHLDDIGRPLFEGDLGIAGRIVGNTISLSPLEGLIITGGKGYLIACNTIQGSEGIIAPDSERIPDNFIDFTGTHDGGTVRDNVFRRNNNHGLDFRSGTFTNMVIQGNTFIDPCRSVGTFCPVAFVGANHTAVVKDNILVTSNALTGFVRGDTASQSILCLNNIVMSSSVIPDFVGSGQNPNRGTLGSVASPYEKIYVNKLAIIDSTTTPADESGVMNMWVSSTDGDLKGKFGDTVVKVIVADT